MSQALRAASIALAAACCLNAGCGPNADFASATKQPAQRIEFWTLALAPFEPYLRERIAAFERIHPGAQVVWVDVPFEAIDRKLTAAAAAGRAPDVLNLSDRTFGRFAGLGAMADLRPLLEFRAEDIYLDGALSIGRFGNRLLAVPWYLTTQISMVNAELLDRGGLKFDNLARDWSGLRSQAIAYRAKTGKHLFSLPLGEESQLPIIMWAENLRPLRPSAADGGRLVSNLLDERVAAYIRGWVDFYRSGAMPSEAATRDHSHLTEMYQNRELAQIDSGPNFLKRVQDVAPGVYASTVARAPVTGMSGKSHIATMVVAVTRRSRQPKLASQFAAFITSPESQTEFCRLAPILPSTPASLRSEIFTAQESSTDKVAAARSIAAASLRDAVALTPAMEVWPDLRRAFEESMKRMLLDARDTDAELRELNDTWNAILSEGPPAFEECLPRLAPGIEPAEARP